MAQAGTDTSGKWMGIDNAEKFAELIVKECVETINDRVLNSDGSGDWYKGYCDGAVAACREINQHFGVES
jgi:hypothetical protein